MLTHSCSLGYNGAVLQALAVHLSLQGALDLPHQFISRLIKEMEEVEGDETARNDARMWVDWSEAAKANRVFPPKESIAVFL